MLIKREQYVTKRGINITLQVKLYVTLISLIGKPSQ